MLRWECKDSVECVHKEERFHQARGEDEWVFCYGNSRTRTYA